MFYLVVQNLGVERCIHRSEENVYTDGMSLSCTPALEFPGGEPVKEISMFCSEVQGPPLRAKVYRN